MKNCETSNAPIASEAQVDLHKTIRELFRNCGDSQSINETLWDMLQGSISNPDLPTDSKENGERAYLYKRLTEFFIAIEPFKLAIELPQAN